MSAWCCKMREKFLIGIVDESPDLPVPTEAADFIVDWGSKETGKKPTIAVKFCPFCGKAITPTDPTRQPRETAVDMAWRHLRALLDPVWHWYGSSSLHEVVHGIVRDLRAARVQLIAMRSSTLAAVPLDIAQMEPDAQIGLEVRFLQHLLMAAEGVDAPVIAIWGFLSTAREAVQRLLLRHVEDGDPDQVDCEKAASMLFAVQNALERVIGPAPKGSLA